MPEGDLEGARRSAHRARAQHDDRRDRLGRLRHRRLRRSVPAPRPLNRLSLPPFRRGTPRHAPGFPRARPSRAHPTGIASRKPGRRAVDQLGAPGVGPGRARSSPGWPRVVRAPPGLASGGAAARRLRRLHPGRAGSDSIAASRHTNTLPQAGSSGPTPGRPRPAELPWDP